MREEILSMLKKEALKLNRNLKKEEVLSLVSKEDIEKYFKNASQIIRLLSYQFSKEELIQILQDKAQELGRTPNVEMGFPSAIIYINQFSSWDNALKIAGLIYEELSDDYLINIIKENCNKFKAINNKNKLINQTVIKDIIYDQNIINLIILRFGSWHNALIKAEIIKVYYNQGKKLINTNKSNRSNYVKPVDKNIILLNKEINQLVYRIYYSRNHSLVTVRRKLLIQAMRVQKLLH